MIQRSLVRWGVLVMLVLEIGWGCPTAWSGQADEYALKSAFTYNFILFNRWPEHVVTGLDGEIRLCIVGAAKGEKAFQKMDGKRVDERTLKIRFFDHADELDACQVLFIGKDVESATVLRILTKVKGLPVLTIGETEGFLAMGGVINFFIKNGKQFFQVDLRNMKRQHLQLSSRLLKLAVIEETSDEPFTQ